MLGTIRATHFNYSFIFNPSLIFSLLTNTTKSHSLSQLSPISNFPTSPCLSPTATTAGRRLQPLSPKSPATDASAPFPLPPSSSSSVVIIINHHHRLLHLLLLLRPSPPRASPPGRAAPPRHHHYPTATTDLSSPFSRRHQLLLGSMADLASPPSSSAPPLAARHHLEPPLPPDSPTSSSSSSIASSSPFMAAASSPHGTPTSNLAISLRFPTPTTARLTLSTLLLRHLTSPAPQLPPAPLHPPFIGSSLPPATPVLCRAVPWPAAIPNPFPFRLRVPRHAACNGASLRPETRIRHSRIRSVTCRACRVCRPVPRGIPCRIPNPRNW